MSSTPAAAVPLSHGLKLGYGLGSVAFGVASQVLSAAILQLYFNQVIGLPAVWVGAVIMLSLIVDAVIDPMIGQWSDNFRSPLGRRHPFMYASAVPAALSFYLLWRAPEGLGVAGLFGFMIVMLVSVRVSVALYEIPSTALAPELAPDYDQRTTLLAYRWFFGVLAASVMIVLLYLVFLRQDAAHPLGVLDRSGYARFGAVASVLMFVCILLSGAATQARAAQLHQAPPRRVGLVQTFGEIGAVVAHPALLALMISGLLSGIAGGLTSGLSTYFYIHLWGLKPQMISPLVGGGLMASVIGIVFAPAISRALGKKRAMISLFTVSLATSWIPLGTWLLGLMPPQGSPITIAILFADVVVSASLGMMGFVIVSSMVADVVDDIAARSGRRAEGVLFAANGLVPKFTTGIGAFLAGLLVTLVKFPTHALPGSVDPHIVRQLALAYLPLSGVLSAGSIAVLGFYRIDRAAHQRNLEHYRQAAAAVELNAFEDRESAGAQSPRPG
jgi:GPH family glycoside/pentoside/hexuronide:cation symporter